MKILIIKTSSLGDIIHTFPALTDAQKNIPNIKFDWVVEEAFATVPTWHPAVRRVIPVAIRKWRKNPLRYIFNGSIRKCLKALRREKYDAIIDAQGLLKSAVLTYLAKGFRIGLDKKSLTESLARFAYQKKLSVDLSKQAVFRMRSIFSKALDYTLPKTNPKFNLGKSTTLKKSKPKLILIHGTTWPSKHWPDQYWIKLASLATQAGFQVQLPWYSEQEHQRVKIIKKNCPEIHILPKMSLDKIKETFKKAQGAVGVDTGLSHIAAACGLPLVTLFGPTNPERTGTVGKNTYHLKPHFKCIYCDKKRCYYGKKWRKEAICMSQLTPKLVWGKLLLAINKQKLSKAVIKNKNINKVSDITSN